MALPEPLDDFWSEWRALNGSRRPTAWGEVVTDARYPLVWESNHAAVLRDHDSVSAADIRGELLPALQQAGARNEHVEFWAPPPGCPVIVQMARGSDHLGTDSIMVHEGGPDALLATPRHAGVRVRELEDPDEDFWSVYRSSRDEFGGELRAEVIDELVRRDRELLVPAGLRVYAGFAGDELAGFATVVSLGGVGYVDNVVTLPAHRKQGIATATTSLAVRMSLMSGDRAVHLLTERGGAPQRLYERIGFRPRATVTSITRRLP